MVYMAAKVGKPVRAGGVGLNFKCVPFVVQKHSGCKYLTDSKKVRLELLYNPVFNFGGFTHRYKTSNLKTYAPLYSL